jgi:anti-anti-sigma factor
MEITVSQEHGRVPVTVFHIRGELTADTAAPFQAAVKAAIESGTRNLVLDLTNCGFIGSFGIRAINDALITMYQANGMTDADVRKALRSNAKADYLKLMNPSPQVMKVLETSGFDMLLEVHRDLAGSLKSFG